MWNFCVGMLWLDNCERMANWVEWYALSHVLNVNINNL